MYQHFPRPDLYVGRCGSLEAALTEHRIPGAPEFMRGLSALFIADTHVLRRTTAAQLDAFAERIAGIAPELLLLGGDYSDDAEGAARLFDALAGLTFPLGAFGVVGNNDSEAWAGCLYKLRKRMARADCRLLVNESARLKRRGGTLWIAGVDDHRHGNPVAAGLYPARPRDDIYRILLSHFPILPDIKPDLMLSGHTHGGQFNLLGLTPFAIGFERLKPRLPSVAISGLFGIDGMKLLVSKGVGASRIQLRVGARPEINLLRFE